MTPSEMIDWIEDHARKLYERTGRPSTSRLVYLTSPYDFMAITNAVSVARPVPPSDAGFELHTPAGYVEVAGDPSAPRGAIVQVFRCPCDSLFLDNSSRTGRCPVCREWTPGDAVPSTRTTCARCSWPLEIDGLSDEDADRLIALHRERCPDYDAYARCLEGAKIRTPAGDITVRADPTLKPGEFRLEQQQWSVIGVDFGSDPSWLAYIHGSFHDGVFRIEPDPADLAERMAARVEVHTERERIAIADRDLRPDGFTQSAVNAAKAVLLRKVERKR